MYLAIDQKGARAPCEPQFLMDYLKGLAPTFCEHVSEDLADQTGRGIFLMCTADYGPSDVFNHWVPGFCAGQIGADVYAALLVSQDLEIESQLLSLAAEINKIEAGEEGLDGLETEACLAMSVSKHEEMQRLLNWQGLVARCRKHNYTPVEVPADGNCLLWTLKALLQNDFMGKNLEVTDQTNLKILEGYRRQLVQNWKCGKDSPSVQQLFNVVRTRVENDGDDLQKASKVKEEEPNVLHTPKRPKVGELHAEPVDLCTPPAPECRRGRDAHRVEGCRRAPGWQPPKVSSPTLASRKAKRSKCTSSQPEAKQTQNDQEERMDQEVPEAEPSESRQEDADAQKLRKKRKRVGRKREKSPREIKLKQLKDYCASIYLDYHGWQGAHWRRRVEGC